MYCCRPSRRRGCGGGDQLLGRQSQRAQSLPVGRSQRLTLVCLSFCRRQDGRMRGSAHQYSSRQLRPHRRFALVHRHRHAGAAGEKSGTDGDGADARTKGAAPRQGGRHAPAAAHGQRSQVPYSHRRASLLGLLAHGTGRRGSAAGDDQHASPAHPGPRPHHCGERAGRTADRRGLRAPAAGFSGQSAQQGVRR